MKKTLIAAALAALAAGALAKLPAPVLDDAAKAKAAEAAARTAWAAKKDAYALCKAQDRVAAMYKKTAKPAAATDPKSAPTKAMPAAAAASGTAGTPVVMTTAAAPAACADPGPFAYNQPSQTPLETAGAHSPAGTAKSPPSVRAEAAKMQPPAAKKP